MPDVQGNFKGQGWSRKREENWCKAFGASEPDSETPTEEDNNTMTQLSARVEHALKAAGLPVPYQHTIDERGFTSQEVSALDKYYGYEKSPYQPCPSGCTICQPAPRSRRK